MVLGLINLVIFIFAPQPIWSKLLIGIGIVTTVLLYHSIPALLTGILYIILGLFGANIIAIHNIALLKNGKIGRAILAAGGLLIITVAAIATSNHTTATASSSDDTSAKTTAKKSSTATTVYGTHGLKVSVATSVMEEHYWKITGSTTAPDNAKIVIMSADEDEYNSADENMSEADEVNWITVKNGKFTTYVDPIDAMDTTETLKAGQHAKVYVVALTNYHKAYDDTLSENLRTIIKKSKPLQLTLNSTQATYFNSLGSNDSDSDSDTDSSSSDSTDTDSSTDTDTTSSNDDTSDEDTTVDSNNNESDTTDDDASSSSAEKTTASSTKSTNAENTAALNKAESYANEMDMSKQGVYDQLTSDYGEGFTATAAQYAIDNLTDVDWNANALAKAKSYQEDQDMSTNEIQEQLTSADGEQFTQSQAQYAIDHLSD